MPARREVPFARQVRTKVSAYVDYITLSCRLDILAVKKAVEMFEEVEDAKINFDKSESLWLGAWRGNVPLPEPFR